MLTSGLSEKFMTEFKKEKYLKIAENVLVFSPSETEVVKEILDDYEKNPEKNYYLLGEKQGDAVLGFVIFGRTPLTESSWDIYWLMVDKYIQGKGIGRKLLKKAEEFISLKQKGAVLRVETSTRKEFDHARNLYLKQGFKEVGRIPHFYGKGDDLIIYYKGNDVN